MNIEEQIRSRINYKLKRHGKRFLSTGVKVPPYAYEVNIHGKKSEIGWRQEEVLV